MVSSFDMQTVLKARTTLERDVVSTIEDIVDDLDKIPRAFVAEDLEGHFLDLDADLAALRDLKEEHGLYHYVLLLQPTGNRCVESLQTEQNRLRRELHEIYELLTSDWDLEHVHHRLDTWLSRFRDLGRAEQELLDAASQK